MTDKERGTAFERQLQRCQDGTFRLAAIEVCDTAYFALLWLRDHDLQPTAADVLLLTDMILAQERRKVDKT